MPLIKTILLIEDEANLAQLVFLALTNEGYQAFTASDGVKGLEMAGTKNPDLIILDILMPPPDGWTVLQTLKAATKTSKIPVLVLTTQGLVQHIDRAMALGAADYMVKPFDVVRLLQKVARIIGPEKK